MRLGVHLLLIHEVPGARLGDNEARHACVFEHFFDDDTTPKHLLKAGIYNSSAHFARRGYRQLQLGLPSFTRLVGLSPFAEHVGSDRASRTT